MSDDVAISVQNLTKIYKLYDSPQDRLKEALNPLRKKYHRDFYALNDVSFEIRKGETVGIIGRNGAGKSTLLKIITGVIAHSGGNIRVNGRISALLELGAGFNPDISGLENVYFNGTLLGFSKEEMDAKVQEIIDFADIGTFIHQPVKTYSSGMKARLAFATAINVDPEILIVDEALAVGDARFSKKCYDRFRLFREGGKTILLVTHDVETVKTYAGQAIFLDEGRVIYQGEPKEAVSRYLRLLFPIQHKIDFAATSTVVASDPVEETAPTVEEPFFLEFSDFNSDSDQPGKLAAQFSWVKISGIKPPNIFHGGETVQVALKIVWTRAEIQLLMLQHDLISNIIIGLRMQNKKGFNIFSTNTFVRDITVNPLDHDQCELTIKAIMPKLCPDDYFISVALSLGTQDKHIGLVTNSNLVHLKCSPLNKFYDFIDFDHEFVTIQFN